MESAVLFLVPLAPFPGRVGSLANPGGMPGSSRPGFESIFEPSPPRLLFRKARLFYAMVLALGLLAVVWLDRAIGPHQELGFFYLAIIVLACLELGLPGLLFVPLAFASYLGNVLARAGPDRPAFLFEHSVVSAASFAVVGVVAAMAHQGRVRLEAHRQALEVAVSQHEAVLRCLPDFVLVLDQDMRIRGTGGAFHEHLGLSPGELEGVALGDLEVGHAGAGFEKLAADLSATTASWSALAPPPNPDRPQAHRITLETRLLDAVAGPIRAVRGDLLGWVVLLRDVTDLVQTQELLLARARSLAVQETRRQLARHLHDNVTQTLAAIRLRLEVAAAAAQGGLDPSQVHELQDGLGQAIRELRQTMWELRPTVLEKLPFAQALRAYLEDLGSRSGFRARLEVEGRVDLQPEREVLLFRVVQEAVTNALKHSQAEEVLVRLEARDGHLAVEIRDDGVGFDVQAAGMDPLRKSFGLRDMQDRARVLGSELLIRSDPGHGTRVSLSVPREPRQEALQ